MLNATSILASAPYCDHSNILLQHAVTHFQVTPSPSAPHVCSRTWAWGLGDACLLLQRSWPHWQRHCGWTWTLHRSSSTEEQRCVRVEVTHCQCKVLWHPPKSLTSDRHNSAKVVAEIKGIWHGTDKNNSSCIYTSALEEASPSIEQPRDIHKILPGSSKKNCTVYTHMCTNAWPTNYNTYSTCST